RRIPRSTTRRVRRAHDRGAAWKYGRSASCRTDVLKINCNGVMRRFGRDIREQGLARVRKFAVGPPKAGQDDHNQDRSGGAILAPLFPAFRRDGALSRAERSGTESSTATGSS